MKKILLVVITLLTLISCDKEKPVKDYFILSGEIKNFRKRNIKLIGYNYSKKIKFDRKSKTFKDTLRNLKEGHYTLKVGKREVPLYISDTTDTSIKLDAKKRVKDPVFKGNNASINKYLAQKKKKFGLILGNYIKFLAKDEADFLDQNKKYEEALFKLAENSKLPTEYLEKEKRNIKYEIARYLYNYQAKHRLLIGDEEYKTSKDLTAVVNDIDFNNSVDYVNSFQYRELIKEYLSDLADKKTPEDGDLYLTHLETVHTEITDTLVKNDLIHNVAEKAVTYTTNLSEFYKKYMGYSTSDKNKREITKTYNQLKLTATGQPSPKFDGYQSIDGKKVALDDLLNKGKYLYIDIWATWCGFCKKEIPLLKNFEVKYHGKNIEFVSISVDKKSDMKKWKKMVAENEMGGVQLFSGDTKDNLKFTKDYLVKGLPRFILLDPQGKIITSNAPRPSDGERLHEIFEELGLEDSH